MDSGSRDAPDQGPKPVVVDVDGGGAETKDNFGTPDGCVAALKAACDTLISQQTEESKSTFWTSFKKYKKKLKSGYEDAKNDQDANLANTYLANARKATEWVCALTPGEGAPSQESVESVRLLFDYSDAPMMVQSVDSLKQYAHQNQNVWAESVLDLMVDYSNYLDTNDAFSLFLNALKESRLDEIQTNSNQFKVKKGDDGSDVFTFNGQTKMADGTAFEINTQTNQLSYYRVPGEGNCVYSVNLIKSTFGSVSDLFEKGYSHFSNHEKDSSVLNFTRDGLDDFARDLDKVPHFISHFFTAKFSMLSVLKEGQKAASASSAGVPSGRILNMLFARKITTLDLLAKAMTQAEERYGVIPELMNLKIRLTSFAIALKQEIDSTEGIGFKDDLNTSYNDSLGGFLQNTRKQQQQQQQQQLQQQAQALAIKIKDSLTSASKPEELFEEVSTQIRGVHLAQYLTHNQKRDLIDMLTEHYELESQDPISAFATENGKSNYLDHNGKAISKTGSELSKIMRDARVKYKLPVVFSQRKRWISDNKVKVGLGLAVLSVLAVAGTVALAVFLHVPIMAAVSLLIAKKMGAFTLALSAGKVLLASAAALGSAVLSVASICARPISRRIRQARYNGRALSFQRSLQPGDSNQSPNQNPDSGAASAQSP